MVRITHKVFTLFVAICLVYQCIRLREAFLRLEHLCRLSSEGQIV